MLFVAAIIVSVFFIITGHKKPLSAFIVYLITSMLAFFAFGDLGIDIALTIFPSMLIGISTSRSEAGIGRWAKICARWVLLLFGGGSFVAGGFILFGPWGVLGVFFVLFLVTLAIGYGATSRIATAAFVISTIGASVRQNLPLSMALESAAIGRNDKGARILLRIKKWLIQGYSLSESIKRGYPRCPSFAAAMIAAAERINQLPAALAAIEADIAAKANESRKVRPVHPAYPVILLFVMFLMVLGLTKYIFPRFVTVINEMFEGARLPAATRFIAMFVSRTAPYLGYGFVLIVFVIVPLCVYFRFRSRRPQQPYRISRVGDFIKWHLPILHWFEHNYSLLQVVEVLRLSLKSGCTLNEGIANTINLDVNECFRKRLRKWLAKVEGGDNVSVSALESKLGNSLAWAFDQQTNQYSTFLTLETVESLCRSNYSYRVNLARFVMWPCVTIALGLLVGFIVYAVFSPMVMIINTLAASITP